MRLKNIGGSKYKIQAPRGKAEHINGLTQALACQSTTEDLIFHCQNKSIVRTNKMFLIFNSKLFVKLLPETCPCPSALNQEYDVICPDFDPHSMSGVLELITTGATIIDNVDQHIYEGMLFIIDCLQINIRLEETWSTAQTTKLKFQKAWTVSKSSSSGSSSTTDERDSAYFDSDSCSSKEEIKNCYKCQICDKEFNLLFGLKKHLKQHLDLVKIAEPDFNMPESDQEQENIAIDTTTNSEIEDVNLAVVNLSTLVDSNQDNKIDTNNQFFCHECSTNMRSFESFEQHMEQHFMKIENDSSGATIETILTDAMIKGGASDDGNTIDIKHLKHVVQKMRTQNKRKDSKIEEEASNDNREKEKKQDNKDGMKPCPICHLSSTRLDHLLVHVGSQHFKQHILDSYVDQDPQTCKKCQRSFVRKEHLVSHIILKHRVLKYIAPKHIYQKLESLRTPHYTRAESKR